MSEVPLSFVLDDDNNINSDVFNSTEDQKEINIGISTDGENCILKEENIAVESMTISVEIPVSEDILVVVNKNEDGEFFEINPNIEDVDFHIDEQLAIFYTKISGDYNNMISTGTDGGVFFEDVGDLVAYYNSAKA